MTEPINKIPVFVNFENTDSDGAIWLQIPYKSAVTLKPVEFFPMENETLWITDGDVEVTGIIKFKIDRWVVCPESKFKNVDIMASYHTTMVNWKMKYPLEDENGLCKQCGHPFDPHMILVEDKNNPTKGTVKCQIPGCACEYRWGVE